MPRERPKKWQKDKKKKKKIKKLLGWSSAVAQRVKDLALSLQWLRSLLWCAFDPWPRNFCMPCVQSRQTKGKKKSLVVILSEVKVRQRKSDIIGSHLYVESKKNDANELIYKTETAAQT